VPGVHVAVPRGLLPLARAAAASLGRGLAGGHRLAFDHRDRLAGLPGGGGQGRQGRGEGDGGDERERAGNTHENGLRNRLLENSSDHAVEFVTGGSSG
jgi:hypothetical protein